MSRKETFIIEEGQKPTEEQLREVMEAKKYPIEFDEDCLELSPVMYKAFRSVVIQRNRKKLCLTPLGRTPNWTANRKVVRFKCKLNKVCTYWSFGVF